MLARQQHSSGRQKRKRVQGPVHTRPEGSGPNVTVSVRSRGESEQQMSSFCFSVFPKRKKKDFYYQPSQHFGKENSLVFTRGLIFVKLFNLESGEKSWDNSRTLKPTPACKGSYKTFQFKRNSYSRGKIWSIFSITTQAFLES